MALLDSASTHTILRDLKYFEFFGRECEAWRTCELNIVAGRQNLKFREGWARVVLPRGATLVCNHAMYAPDAHRSLINFWDLRSHGIHVMTALRDAEEILELWQGQKCLATAMCGASGLYEIMISCLPNRRKTMQPSGGSAYSVTIPNKNNLWHRQMGHPGTIMFRRMLPLLTGHEVYTSDANKVGVCDACAQRKLILKPSRWKLPSELPPPLQWLQGDICGPITPASWSFRYLLVLVNDAGIYFEVFLLSTQNIAFAKGRLHTMVH